MLAHWRARRLTRPTLRVCHFVAATASRAEFGLRRSGSGPSTTPAPPARKPVRDLSELGSRTTPSTDSRAVARTSLPRPALTRVRLRSHIADLLRSVTSRRLSAMCPPRLAFPARPLRGPESGSRAIEVGSARGYPRPSGLVFATAAQPRFTTSRSSDRERCRVRIAARLARTPGPAPAASTRHPLPTAFALEPVRRSRKAREPAGSRRAFRRGGTASRCRRRRRPSPFPPGARNTRSGG